MVLKAIKLDMTHITSGRNVISIEHTTNAVFVVFWVVLTFRGGEIFIRFSLKRTVVLYLQIFKP